MKTPRRLKVSIACLRLPIAPYLMCGRSIVQALSDNPSYPEVYPPLEVVDLALTDLETKAHQAANGDRVALANRNQAWGETGELLRQLASFVQIHCRNELAVLLSSGFVPTKPRRKIGSLPAPGNLRASPTGISGEMKLRIGKVRGARAGYTVQLADAADGPFADFCHSTSSRILLPGLPPMTYRWVRARAVGTAGPGPWSTPLRLTVT